MFNEIRIQIVLTHPVEGLVYGLQKGKGARYETVQAQPGKGEALTFDFLVQVKSGNGSNPSLAGPYVQGPRGSRFVYIGIGRYVGQVGAAWNGRLKVPLPGAAFETASLNGTNSTWSCTVPGSTAEGAPVFATVKPFSGWSIRAVSH